MELAQFVVARAAIQDDLDAVQCHGNVRAVGREELLANLDSDAAVLCPDDGVSKRHRCLHHDGHTGLYLASDALDEERQMVVLDVSQPRPFGKPARFPIDAAVCKVKLRPDQHNPSSEDDDATVVADILVHRRPARTVGEGKRRVHANVDEHFAVVIAGNLQDLAEHLPRVHKCVYTHTHTRNGIPTGLEKVVVAGKAAHFELWTGPDASLTRVGNGDALQDALEVSAEIKCPLVEGAACDDRDGRHACAGSM